VIHAGEGTDEAAKMEIDQLIQWNFLQRDIVAVHAIAMTADQAENFRAVIWCPLSNYFLFNETAGIENFNIPILFGTDSTLTGSWNIWDHIRLARETGKATDRHIFDMLTYHAGEVWKLKGYQYNKIPCDIIIVKGNPQQKALKNFFETEPEDILMVIQGGRLRLFDKNLLASLLPVNTHNNFFPFEINGTIKYVEGNVVGLMKEIEKFQPDVLFPTEENVFIP
jgi:cytosine/adenosine deaminase-related metal-dependent hydrolase